jgi:NAD(P)-dependent dehydrogenase (short-subunit alcohol dehydrogenase family)
MVLAEEILAVAALIGALASMPIFLEFMFDRSKRRGRIALSLEELDVDEIHTVLAGCDDLLLDIADLIDRARYPDAYRDLRVGNEILIIGPASIGKKTLAKRIAVDAKMDRLLIVHNPRNVDALAKAKHIVQKSGHDKVMLLLPRLDLIDPKEDEELLTELDALIEAATSRANILVIGTAINYVPGSELDNLFGIALAMPGTVIEPAPNPPRREEVTQMLKAVIALYLNKAKQQGDQLLGMSEDEFTARILAAATNPAQIEDIVALCQTAALYRQRSKQTSARVITPQILETVIRRAIITENKSILANVE